MSTLEQLIAERDRTAEKARTAIGEHNAAIHAITEWGKDQVKGALAARGITPGKSIVRMEVQNRRGRAIFKEVECLLVSVGRVSPTTMDRGALGPNSVSSDMWWCAVIWWQNIRKDGTPGAKRDLCMIKGDTVLDVVGKIEHVRDLE